MAYLATEQYKGNQLRVDFHITRGDSINVKLFQAVNSDDTPFNFINYTFAMQVRPHPLSNDILIDIGNDDFLLGQSQEAVDYDAELVDIDGIPDPQGEPRNPEGTTFDEVHVIVAGSRTRIRFGKHYYDLEMRDLTETMTPLTGRFIVKQDVTRVQP